MIRPSSRVARSIGWAISLAVSAAATAVSAAAQTHLVIVSGLGGEKKYTDSFNKLSASLADAAAKRFGIPDSEIFWFGEDSVSTRPHFRGQSTKVNIERMMAQLATRAGAGWGGAP